MEDKKLVKTADNWDTFVKVGGGFFFAFAIVFLIFAVLVLILGEKMFVPGSMTLELDFITLHIAEEYQGITGLIKIHTIVELCVACIFCLIVYYGTKILRRILAPMKNGRPFEADIPGNLKKFAWVVLIGGAVTQILGIAERVILTRAYPMKEIFASAAIEELEYVFSFNFTFVIIFCLIMFLSYIFAYGQKLQQESDETL